MAIDHICPVRVRPKHCYNYKIRLVSELQAKFVRMQSFVEIKTSWYMLRDWREPNSLVIWRAGGCAFNAGASAMYSGWSPSDARMDVFYLFWGFLFLCFDA
jgi:hypothetical protein